MVYKVTYINEMGHKQSKHFMAEDAKSFFKYLMKKDYMFMEILEVKCVVRDYVEMLTYDDGCTVETKTKKAY